MLRQACVYWIKKNNFTDIFSEGYVGVSLEPEKRIKTHLYRVKSNKHGNTNLIENFKDDVIVEVVMIGDEDYCYEIENKLRPNSNIGWNINTGGFKPPSQLGKKRLRDYGKTWSPMLGKKHSEETKRKMSEAQKGKVRWSEEQKLQMSLSRKGKYTEDRLRKMSLAKKGIPTGRSFVKGRFWWNDGLVNKMSVEQPGISFIRGKIMKIKEN